MTPCDLRGRLEASRRDSYSASLELLFGPWLRRAGHCDIFFLSQEAAEAGGGACWMSDYQLTLLGPARRVRSFDWKVCRARTSPPAAGTGGGCRALICGPAASQMSGGGSLGAPIRTWPNVEEVIVMQRGGGASRHECNTSPSESLTFRPWQG